MAPGTLLRMYQALRRIGIAASVSAVGDTITIRTAEVCACFTEEEATALAQEAKQWHPGQTDIDLLWR